jgi:DNA-directed RNA polymerase specialized sigma24 family protein
VYAERCARNRAIDAIDSACAAGRALKADAVSLHADLGQGPEPVSHAATPEMVAVMRGELAALVAAVRELPPRQRACLVGQLNGKSAAALAVELGTTRRGVGMLLLRARQRLATRRSDGPEPQSQLARCSRDDHGRRRRGGPARACRAAAGPPVKLTGPPTAGVDSGPPFA